MTKDRREADNKVLAKLGQNRTAEAVLNLSIGIPINICAKLNRTGDPDLFLECPNFAKKRTVSTNCLSDYFFDKFSIDKKFSFSKL
jgi:hypothetical protein